MSNTMILNFVYIVLEECKLSKQNTNFKYM